MDIGASSAKDGRAMMLGNFSVTDIERRLGIKIPEESKDFLNSCNERNASNIPAGKWHCFDIPFTIVCGDKALAEKIQGILSPFSEEMLTQINIGW